MAMSGDRFISRGFPTLQPERPRGGVRSYGGGGGGAGKNKERLGFSNREKVENPCHIRRESSLEKLSSSD